MNHEWPTAVHKTMIAVDEVTPDAPDLSLISPRPMPPRRPAVLMVAVAVLAVLATVGGLAYLLGRDQRDTTPPAATEGQSTVPTSAQQNEACVLLSDPPRSPAEEASLIDSLLTSDPAALDPAELQKCKAATMVQLRRLQAIVAERQAALDASSASQAALDASSTTKPSPTSTLSLRIAVISLGLALLLGFAAWAGFRRARRTSE